MGKWLRGRDVQALLREQLAVRVDRFPGHLDRFIEGITGREATRQIRNRDAIFDAVVGVESQGEAHVSPPV
jgi:hypothetical protein